MVDIRCRMIKRIINPRMVLRLRTLIPKNAAGFTLVELLTVISIAGILAILGVPAVQSLQNAGGFNKSVYAMADSINLARSYAMANNTYVYVGLTEVDRTQNILASPQVVGNGVGR